LVRYAGQRIASSDELRTDQLRTQIAAEKGGQIELEISRDGQPLKFTALEGSLGVIAEDHSISDQRKPATPK